MISDFQYDVFISYRRSPKGRYWVSEYFKPRLQEELSHCLGRDAKIFIDYEDIQIGAIWPTKLRTGLATSSCIVPILCGKYFRSEWCAREFAIMYNRNIKLNATLNKKDDSFKFILPVLVRDGEHLPTIVMDIQYMPLNDYFTECTSFRDSTDFRVFEKKIQELAKDISESLSNLPSWDPEWLENEWLEDVPIANFYQDTKVNILENPLLK